MLRKLRQNKEPTWYKLRLWISSYVMVKLEVDGHINDIGGIPIQCKYTCFTSCFRHHDGLIDPHHNVLISVRGSWLVKDCCCDTICLLAAYTYLMPLEVRGRCVRCHYMYPLNLMWLYNISLVLFLTKFLISRFQIECTTIEGHLVEPPDYVVHTHLK